MKIAILGTRGIPARYGGFETCVDHTSRLLAAAGHEVIVYGRAGRHDSPRSVYQGVQLRHIPRPGPRALHTIGHTLRCGWDLRHEQVDVVHLYGVGNAFAIPLLRRGGRRVAISVDAQDWAREKWGVVGRNYLLLAARFAARAADCLVVDSRVIGRLYRERFGAQSRYIAYGAETEPAGGREWLEKLGLAPQQYHLFVGRLTPEKRPHQLMAAYRDLRCPFPLVIAGHNPDDERYVAYLHSLATERVRFAGPIYDRGFRELCHHCYLYLTASAVEGTSPALLQAMGQGAAVLVNGTPTNRETIGPAGFTYAENDPADLRRQWQALIDAPSRVAAVRPAAVTRVKLHYTWEKIAGEMEALYRELLAGGQ